MEHEFYAHIREVDGRTEKQLLKDHCYNTAKIAEELLAPVKLGRTAYLAGLIHDMGKYKRKFQSYLMSSYKTEKVNHTFAAAKFLMEKYGNRSDRERFIKKLTAEIIAIAVSNHHGLIDCVNEEGMIGIQHRIDAINIGYEESYMNFIQDCADELYLESLFNEATGEIQEIQKILKTIPKREDKNMREYDLNDRYFYLGMIARLVTSAVVEADRRDTVAYMQQISCPMQKIDWTMVADDADDEYFNHMEQSKIQKDISDQCKKMAFMPGGIYKLMLPINMETTDYSLRYAINHLAKMNKQKLIYIAPKLALHDQIRNKVKKIVKDDRLILDAYDTDLEGQAEPWSAPVILATIDQWLSTLFAESIGKIRYMEYVRRFQTLCNSVIVIDGVEKIPVQLLSVYQLVLSFLSNICNTTIVLCSATQPCLEISEHKVSLEIKDLVPYDKRLWDNTGKIKMLFQEKMELSEIPEILYKEGKTSQSLLVVCNTNEEVRYLYDHYMDQDLDLFYITGSSGYNVLKKVENCLHQNHNRPVVCIASPVVETNIDVKFGKVIRLEAGLDHIIQTAVRGKKSNYDNQLTITVIPVLQEKLQLESCIPEEKEAIEMLRETETFKNNNASINTINEYYHILYDRLAKDKQSQLLDLLTLNTDGVPKGSPDYNKYYLKHAFNKVANDEFATILQLTNL